MLQKLLVYVGALSDTGIDAILTNTYIHLVVVGSVMQKFIRMSFLLLSQLYYTFFVDFQLLHLHKCTIFFALCLTELFSKSTTSRVLKKIGWTWRVPTRFQIHKYTLTNITRYVHYLTVVQTIPWNCLKFVDEAHIVSKQLTNRRVLGPKNHRTWTKESTIHHAHATLTLLTSLSTPTKPIRCSYTESTNTQWSFCDFVVACCVRKDLVAGDYLICDNAAIHGADESHFILTTVLQHYGVKLIYLPAYSPELNPCEPVFSVIKQHIRNHRNGFSHIKQEVIRAIKKISLHHVLQFYGHCIFPKQVLPDLLLNKV